MTVSLRTVWIVESEKGSGDRKRRIDSFVTDQPEDAIAMFAETIFGRNDRYKITQVHKGASVYVQAEEDDTPSDD